ncbi:MAG: tetratricopeptide repeat protein [Spirochaetaceae bacterium]|jgi:tetratricopeptide (TPR) repeat protein|nr:tetratricopeptide repeat protein [Spirochaetaceae bacterium]
MGDSFEKGIALYNLGNYKDALSAFLQCSPEQTTGNISFAYYTGLAYMRLKHYEDALGYLELVVTSGSSLEQVRQCRFLLAVIYNLTHRERLADFELHKLLDSGYKTAEVYSALAYSSWEQKKTNECISYYELAIKKNKKSVTALNGLGYVLACMGKDLTTALKLCKQAVDISPNSAACLDSLGWVYFKLGMLKQARAYLERAERLNNSHKDIIAHMEALVQKEGAPV